ncbi:natriuretic peptides A precursor [Oryzias latipes]|uniref:B-type natriuretic peptide n=3 Tax=Oryzias TaxID=8089 RepID=Q7T1Q2_ORYLA|nr:natriuretic peptides B precursor [Oryzias latipes]BAC79151.1 B-type natriuretic peptide precursor [Oryzias latipes]BAE19677.1 B-type natriuretic peptide precursor [Oryzias latipes]
MSRCSSHRSSHMFFIPFWGLLFILNVQRSTSVPISMGLTNADVNTLKDLLHRLQESVPEQSSVDEEGAVERDTLNQLSTEEEREDEPGLSRMEEEVIRELLSSKNLKSLRSGDSSRRSSGCFGRRMDRIGSMSSLGCNTVGRYNPK